MPKCGDSSGIRSEYMRDDASAVEDMSMCRDAVPISKSPEAIYSFLVDKKSPIEDSRRYVTVGVSWKVVVKGSGSNDNS